MASRRKLVRSPSVNRGLCSSLVLVGARHANGRRWSRHRTCLRDPLRAVRWFVGGGEHSPPIAQQGGADGRTAPRALRGSLFFGAAYALCEALAFSSHALHRVTPRKEQIKQMNVPQSAQG